MLFGIFAAFAGVSQIIASKLRRTGKKKEVSYSSEQVGKQFRSLHKRLLMVIFAIVASLFLAAGIFVWLEQWTFTKAIYFAVQTATVRKIQKFDYLLPNALSHPHLVLSDFPYVYAYVYV
jgi:hypothetical protein